MLQLPRVTAICYDGRPYDRQRKKTYYAIINHLNRIIKFDSIKMFLTYEFERPNVKTEVISKSNIYQYSDFCIYDLHEHFNTDYVLIFQDDGFALNPGLWDDEFYDYDYIGAPWPSCQQWNGSKYRVGNGGFSLRSRALCAFSKTLPKSEDETIRYSAEDARICVLQRGYLNDTDLKVAPVSVARKFSVEKNIDENHIFSNTFGFHGVNQYDLHKIFSLITS